VVPRFLENLCTSDDDDDDDGDDVSNSNILNIQLRAHSVD
jgi:hypothetical protein